MAVMSNRNVLALSLMHITAVTMEFVSPREKDHAFKSFICHEILVPVVGSYWGCRGDDDLKVLYYNIIHTIQCLYELNYESTTNIYQIRI